MSTMGILPAAFYVLSCIMLMFATSCVVKQYRDKNKKLQKKIMTSLILCLVFFLLPIGYDGYKKWKYSPEQREQSLIKFCNENVIGNPQDVSICKKVLNK